MIIYLVTNKINGKKYIGQTTRSLQIRWAEHYKGKHPNSVLYLAVQKYGRENFVVEVISTACSVDELNNLEQIYIKQYDTLAPNGYNLTTGGLNALCSDEARLRMSQGRIGMKLSETHKANIVKHLKGRPVSDETKKKLHESNLNKKRSDVTRQRMSEAKKGSVFSALTRQRMSESHKGKKVTLQTTEKRASISKDTATLIKRLLETESIKKISMMLDVKTYVITDIKRGRTWKDLEV